MKKGTFVRWTSTDEEGTFSHVGQVISHKKGMVTFTDKKGGEMCVPDDDGTFETVRKPRNWAIKKPAVEAKPVKRTVTRTRRSGETKVDLVVKLLRSDPPVDRKDAIAKIVAAGISTPAGASTYYNSAKGML